MGLLIVCSNLEQILLEVLVSQNMHNYKIDN